MERVGRRVVSGIVLSYNIIKLCIILFCGGEKKIKNSQKLTILYRGGEKKIKDRQKWQSFIEGLIVSI